MALPGILPSSLHPGISVILLLILTVQLTSGKRPYWDNINSEKYKVICPGDLLLAPGPFWRRSDINVPLLRDVTSWAFGYKTRNLLKADITTLTNGNRSSIYDLFICVKVFSRSDNLPSLDQWLPSDCFPDGQEGPHCPEPFTSAPSTSTLTSEIVTTPDPTNGNVTTGMKSTGNQNEKVGIIVGSIIGALLLFFLFLILAIIIKRGSLPKPSLVSLRGRISTPTTNTNKPKPDTPNLEYADLAFTKQDTGVIRGEQSQVKYATIDLNAIKKMSEPVMPEAEYANAEITQKGQGYGEPEEVEYATLDLN